MSWMQTVSGRAFDLLEHWSLTWELRRNEHLLEYGRAEALDPEPMADDWSEDSEPDWRPL